VERSHGLHAKCDRFAVGFGVRETPGPTRGIPVAKLLRGWPCACRYAPAPASPPQRFAAVTHGPRRAASYEYHGPAERAADRRVGEVRAPHPPVPPTATRPTLALPRRRSARVRPVHACAARTDCRYGEHERGHHRPPCSSCGTGTPRRRLCVGVEIPRPRANARPHAQQAAKGCSPRPYERPRRPERPCAPRAQGKRQPLDYTHGI